MKRIHLFFVAIALSVATLSIAFASDIKKMSLNFLAPTINGKANVTNPQVGEIVYDSSDSTFWGYQDLSGTKMWIALSPSASLLVPAGSILPFAGTSAPTGYLIADGTAVSRTTYAALFAAIGTAFGDGDGSTTFNLPDLRGRFMRGVDDGSGVDPDASTRTAMANGGNTGDNVGSVQDDDFKSHTHIQDPHVHTKGSDYAGNIQNIQVSNALGASGTNVYLEFNGSAVGLNNTPGTSSTTATNQNTGGSETRPKNIYVNYIIKI